MKKPKLPSRMLIGNVHYQVNELPQHRIDQGVNGDCSNVLYHTIRIDPSLIGAEAIDTLWHETFHAIADVYGIKLSHKQIYQLSNALTHLVRYNPHISNWMEKIDSYADYIMDDDHTMDIEE